jgi:hypothetical protein
MLDAFEQRLHGLHLRMINHLIAARFPLRDADRIAGQRRCTGNALVGFSQINLAPARAALGRRPAAVGGELESIFLRLRHFTISTPIALDCRKGFETSSSAVSHQLRAYSNCSATRSAVPLP